jgi:serine/threonine protein kinase/formylglycine-generating enzyme required for sulfatase activity
MLNPDDQPLPDAVEEEHSSTKTLEPSEGRAVGGLSELRNHVHIPDYRLIKRIGSGAYGEVWLAESVTGALRAVKIVWREDFELTKTFHREFQGIQQFEPISRGHPGLVHILHVGWNEEGGYYYYVMELADDEVNGPNLHDAENYVPRTLGTDLKRHGRLDLHFCQEEGVFLADALHYMHNHGLTHRDVKPANIIYCGGVCKLADIGLVAGFGERSFVGTEGFVPPEGPGTPQADIYSLGKVIYEMTTGKDRMEFPEVPDNLDEAEMPFWKNLNQVIIRACAPDLNERFSTGGEFADALRRVTAVRPISAFQFVSMGLHRAALFLLGSAFCGALWATVQQRDHWTFRAPAATAPPTIALYPTAGKPWRSLDKQWFTFRKTEHVADAPLDIAQFNAFLESTMRSFEGEVVPLMLANKKSSYVVVIPPRDANDYCQWMTERERVAGRLPEGFEYAWRPLAVKRPDGTVASAVECVVRTVEYGTLTLTSAPAPAKVYKDGVPLGETPLSIRAKAGPFEYEVRYPGYKPETVKGIVAVGKESKQLVKMKNIRAVIFGKMWTNTQGMKLLPLGRVMMGDHEVRRRDFKEFVEDRKLKALPEWRLEVNAELDLPISFVTRAEAEAFAFWLTQREQSQEIIDGEHSYRLPWDDEWSMAAGLPREKGNSPAERHMRIEGIYPYGYVWPPPPQSSNLFDEAAFNAAVTKPAGKSPDYKDGFAGLSPVLALKAGVWGFHGLSGNVWEWVQEDFGGEDAALKSFGTVRGGAYTTLEREQLLSCYRQAVAPTDRRPDVGFRLVLTSGRSARDDD